MKIMVRRGAGLFILLAVLTAGGCQEATAPTTGEQVVIVFSQSGGIAGMDLQFTIDGPRGRVVGDRCRGGHGCDWEPGEVLAQADGDRVLALARRFFAHGFFDARDEYGNDCCDQFFYEISYEDDDDRWAVSGSDATLPSQIHDLISDIRAFLDEVRAS